MSELQRLFEIDPFELTDDDLDSLIAHYQNARKLFRAGSAQAGNPKALKSAKPPTTTMDIKL